ncbi:MULTISPECIES: copper homeostasis protein CutC [Vibrio]|uniref:PF03932 family protein CutC n=1 Tax=Vibrio ostreae TaxID=2841925 RepID=A0A975U810_9VIBR|nr:MULTISPECIES: copper homeostasis protein CutC [Vibrio]QXO16808.1 copper homeostasis protein CutC [Vibrio ostreae]WGY46194.1 copper homeostasis protein CutC [Vibrio sp. ABG19]
MPYHLEVCIDTIESLPHALAGGATRIELCSSLALGGLTPSFGLMRQAAQRSSVPVYAMIRPRQGDFLYDADDIACMQYDIAAAHQAGLQGVVLGLLTEHGQVDTQRCRKLIEQAHSLGLGVTFHRAFDQCQDAQQALESIIELGCERLLTSGQAPTALQGADLIAELVRQSNGRIAIMAGAGVNAANAPLLAQHTGVTELHLSGKTTRASKMRFIAAQSKMGAAAVDDFVVPVTDRQTIADTASALKSGA